MEGQNLGPRRARFVLEQPGIVEHGSASTVRLDGQLIGVNGAEEIPEEFRGAGYISDGVTEPALFGSGNRSISPRRPRSDALLAALGSRTITVFVNGTKVKSTSDKFPTSRKTYPRRCVR